MLVIRFKGWSVKLDHQVGSAGKFGIWSFHGSESSYVPDMETILRHAAIRRRSRRKAAKSRYSSATRACRRMSGVP